MAKSSINFQKVSIHSFKHNDRSETKTAETVFKDLSYKNEFDVTAKEAQENFNSLYKNAMSKITGKTRRADKKNTLVEAAVNIKTNTTMQDLKELQKHIEKEFGFTGLQISMHFDEGHYEDDKFITNNHAHMSFFTLDKDTGRQMFRREHINKDKLRELQTDTANILIMDRGTDKRISKTERLEHKEYKRVKRAELAKQKDLKLEIKILREQLQEEKAKRQDYAELEQLNKDLKERIKEKDLTIDDLHSQLSDYSLARKEKDELMLQIAKLKDDNEHKDSLLEKYEYITNNQEELYQSQEKEIKALEDKLLVNEKKNVSRLSMNVYDYKNDISRMVNVATEENKYISKKGFLADTVKTVNEIKSPKTLKDKLINYFKDTYENLKEKYLDLKARYSILEKENKQLKKELAIYKPKDLTAMHEIREETKKEKLKDFFDKKRKEKEQNKNRFMGRSR